SRDRITWRVIPGPGAERSGGSLVVLEIRCCIIVGSVASRTFRTRPGQRRGMRLLLHEGKMLLRVAGPIILSQLGTVGMNTMDTLMVGPLGASSLAAAGLGTALHS